MTTAVTCVTCGAELRPTAKFCDECGSDLRPTAVSATPAEYKQVTVLFADVVRSMDIAATVGAERLREIMTELITHAAAVVQRYGGTVDKFTGDGIMAVFGAPVALEDHALRACLAALAFRRTSRASQRRCNAATASTYTYRLAVTPGDDGLAVRDIWLLRLRALLARARGETATYKDFRESYRDMANSLGFEGHIAWAETMP